MAHRIELDTDRLLYELGDPNPHVVERAVAGLRKWLARTDGADFRLGVEGLCSLFYIDTADRPDLETALERTTEVLAEQGGRVVPVLLALMQGSDLKSHIHLARILGRIGPPALQPLRELLAASEDPYSRAFALYAIGKMSCAECAQALPEMITGLAHPDKEVRDTAARTLGIVATVVPPAGLTEPQRGAMFDALLGATQDHQPAVRAKAFRSLGKMASAGLLGPDRLKAFLAHARAALGQSESKGWDYAFIVRREAEEALSVAKGAESAEPA